MPGTLGALAARLRPLPRVSAIVLILVFASAPAHAVTATWLGGTGNWDDPTQWDSNPNYPCNGQGGNNYDVIFGSGNVTLNLDCTVDSYTQTTATFGGAFDLLISGAFAWSGGSHGGAGTTTVNGGLNVSGGANKVLGDTRTLVHAAGTGSWSAGSIALGSGGATLRNQTTWNATGSSRSLNDTGDSGTFENTSSGILNVDLTTASSILTLSPGSLQNAGTMNANVGILALIGDGTHTGNFGGTATLRFDGGDQVLGTGANVTVADLEVDGGTLDVEPGASFGPANTDVTGGTLNVTDMGDTITSTTATLTSGTLGGPGGFTTTGSFGWSGGTMSGAGTTTVNGGLNVSGGANKFLGDTRTLVHAAGTGSWSAGSIALGSGGATLRNQTTWNATGSSRSLSDTSDSGTFENTSSGILNVDLTTASSILTLSPGSLQNAGTMNANVGILALIGDGTHTGNFGGTATLRFDGGDQVLDTGANVTVADLEVDGGTLDVEPGASYAPANTDVTGGTLNVTDMGDTITSTTATLTSGTLGGPGGFSTTGSFGWSGGTMSGAGTTTVNGGLNVSGGANKFLGDTRTLVHAAGTGSWSAGSIALGSGGATLRNQTTWNATGSSRSLNDASDSGTFENTSSGILNVDLTTASSILTLSPGSLQNAGTMNANVGILALIGDGTHTGNFGGTATLRFDGGDQVLDTGANVTVADLEVDAGTLDVTPGASYGPTNTDITGGTLNVTDAADTITSGTATLSSGTLGGPGSFATTGSFGWSGGTMIGAGTTTVNGGLNVSGGANKFLEDTRTLVHAGGTGTWSAGNIGLGSGGATLRNGADWTVTGGSRSLSDTSDSGTFENTSSGDIEVMLNGPASRLTISTGTATNAGVISIGEGTLDFTVQFIQTAGSTRLTGGSLEGPPLLDFQGGLLEGQGPVDGDVSMAGALAPGLSPGLGAGQLDIDGTLTFLPGSGFDVELLGPVRGDEYDSVTATGAVALDGALSVDVEESFRSQVPSDPFVILEQTAGSAITGSFTNVASGERIFTPDLDSFVVRYGAGSPAGSDRVVLEDYVIFAINSGLMVSGTSAGGTITMIIDGVTVEVVIPAGLTAAEVAQLLADAVNANSTLRQMGIVAITNGDQFLINGLLENKTNTDPGISLSSPFNVPTLTGLGLVLLSGLLAALGLRARRRMLQ